jgi:hypothetical protein
MAILCRAAKNSLRGTPVYSINQGRDTQCPKRTEAESETLHTQRNGREVKLCIGREKGQGVKLCIRREKGQGVKLCVHRE